jgi:hypothetical protein
MYEIFMLIQALRVSIGSSVLRDLITSGKQACAIELHFNKDALAVRV